MDFSKIADNALAALEEESLILDKFSFSASSSVSEKECIKAHTALRAYSLLLLEAYHSELKAVLEAQGIHI